jgi:transposase
MSWVRKLRAENRRLERENARLTANNARLIAEHAQMEGLLEEARRQLCESREREAQQAQAITLLTQKNRKLARRAWGKKSERSAARKKTTTEPAASRAKKTSDEFRPRVKHGPKPFDPNLPRVHIKLPDPPPEARICPVTGQPMQFGFTDEIEVLEIIPACVVVRVLERNVFVSPGKSAPVYTPWPDDVFARPRVHASVLGHIAAERYSEHQPFNRMEKKLERAGVRLPRATQVSLMQQLDKMVRPAAEAIKDGVMKSAYIQLDPTPVPLRDPARPGGTVESTIWGYRAAGEDLVWYQFEYERGKSPDHPDRELKAANFTGKLQVDGANGLNKIGVADQVIALGCLSHGRRYAHDALVDGDENARVYLELYNKIFKIDRIAKRFKFDENRRYEWRQRYSVPLFDLMVAMAEEEIKETMPDTLLWSCLHYLLEQQEYLRRCLTTRDAELTNNAAERALRGLKTGVRNWMFVGHPKAGPRLANLFTVVENCRRVGANVEAYITDLVTRLPGHPAQRIAELLPAAWKQARERAKAAADPPAA